MLQKRRSVTLPSLLDDFVLYAPLPTLNAQVKVHDEAITRTPPLLLSGSYRVPSSSGGEGGASSPPPSSLSAPSSSQAVDEGMLTAATFRADDDVFRLLAIRRPVPTEGKIALQPGRKNLLRLPAHRTRIKSHDLLGPGCTRLGRCVCRDTRSDTQCMELE
jgi:hypothetical protein